MGVINFFVGFVNNLLEFINKLSTVETVVAHGFSFGGNHGFHRPLPVPHVMEQT